MAINNFRFNLDIEKEDYIPKLKVKQYDTAIFYVNLFKNSGQFSVTNETIKIFVKKSDGNVVYQEDGITLDGSTIKINVNNQALTCSGLTYAELELKSSDGQVTSSTFVYEVKEKVGSDKAIESVTDIATLDKLKKYMEDAKKELEKFKNDFSKIEDLVANKDKLEGQNEDAKKNIIELGKILEDANNITSDEGKYIVGNNVVSESTNGYIQGLKICGRSLVNLATKKQLSSISSETSLVESKMNLIRPIPNGTKVTVIGTITADSNAKDCILSFYDSSGSGKGAILTADITPYIGKRIAKEVTLSSEYGLATSFRLYTRPQTPAGTKCTFDDIIILEGDYTQNYPNRYFEGLVNVENNEGLNVTTCNANLFDESLLKDRLEDDGYYHFKSSGNTRASFFFGIVDKNNQQVTTMTPNQGVDLTTINLDECKILIGLNGDIKDDKCLFPISNFAIRKFPIYKGCTYEIVDSNHIRVKSVFIQKGYDNAEYNPHKSDKKPILFKDTDNKWKPITDLPGYWENGKFIWGDTIEQHSDGKYYLHIRTKTAKGTDLIGLVKEQNFPNRDGYYGFLPNKEGIKLSVPDKSNPYIICDKLKSVGTYIIAISQYSDVDCISYDPKYQCIRLSVPKGTNINTYLAEKNITFILPIDEKVYECLDITTRAFRNKTMLSIDSRVIDPGIFYYVPTGFLSADNSISEKVETLDKYSEKNIKDINDLTSTIENNYFNINRGLLTDFNNGVKEGKYYVHSSSLIPNSPPTSQTGLFGIVQVFYKNYNELFQLVALHNSELWIRFRNGQDKWNPWSKILNSQDFETQHGSNGFLKFPNGSVLQFGSGVTNNGVLRINFKLTFAKSDDIVLSGSALDPSPQTIGFRNLTTTGCELTCSWAANPVGVKWFAFGEIQ